MKNVNRNPVNSGIYSQLEQLPMSNAQRVRAFEAVQTGYALADSILWIRDQLKRAFGVATPTPLKTKAA